MAELHGVPGGAEIWKIGRSKYVVFTVPDSEPPIYMRWVVPSEEDHKALFGPDVTPTYDRTITWEEARAIGMLDFGTTTELANLDEDPFLTWAQTMETQAAVQPWIMDDDYQTLVAMATLEGRPLSEAEIQGTDWWQTHSQEQREWMKLYHGDPETAEARIEDNRYRAAEALRQAGVENASVALINYMADSLTKGEWSTVYFQNQVSAIADPMSGHSIDPGARKYVSGKTGTTNEGELQVAELAREWLGPVYGAWDDTAIRKWAGKLRNDPNAEDDLRRHLQAQRLAMFPEYADDSLSYEDIAQPWRTFGQQYWGQQMDETSTTFTTMLKNNDAQANAELLRTEGLNRNIGKVVEDARTDLLRTGGGQLRQAL